jgi:hypothetical protein
MKLAKWEADGVSVEQLVLNVLVATEALAVATTGLEACLANWSPALPY